MVDNNRSLAVLSDNQIKSLVENVPARQRAVLSKALSAAANYSKQTLRDFDKACQLLEGMFENELLLGQELNRLFADGQMGRGGDTAKRKFLRLDYADFGISHQHGDLIRKIGKLQTWDELRAWFLEQIDQDKRIAPKLWSLLKLVREPVQTPALPTGVFRVLYADPPWKYGDELIDGYGAAEHHYRTLSTEELLDMEDEKGNRINDLAGDNSVLFLWATCPMLREALDVSVAWGFDYKAQFVWDKVDHNFGHYNSVRHELLLLCTRGTCLPDRKTLRDSVQTIKRSEVHSKKPDEFYQIVETMYDGPYLELFARKPRNGWSSWGAEMAG